MSSPEDNGKRTLQVVVNSDLDFKCGLVNSNFLQSSAHAMTADGPARLLTEDEMSAVVTLEDSIDVDEGVVEVDQYTGQLLGIDGKGDAEISAVEFDYADSITYRNSVEVDDIERDTEQLATQIKQQFTGRFVGRDETLPVSAESGRISLEVHDIDPDDVTTVRVTEDTEISAELVDKGDMSGVVPSSDELELTAEDVHGREEQFRELQTIVNTALNEPEVFEDYPEHRGVLLHGPKGGGKTLMAKAAANEADVTLRTLSPETLDPNDLDSVSSLRDVFRDARRYQPSLVLIENLDQILREDGTNQVATVLRSVFDSLTQENRVLVVGEVSRIEDVPEDFHQQGRFGRDLWVGMPDRDARRTLVQDKLGGIPNKLTADEESTAVDMTVGYTGRDIDNLFVNATSTMHKRVQAEYPDYENVADAISDENEGLRIRDLEEAHHDMTSSVELRYPVEDILYSDTDWSDLIGVDEQVQTILDMIAGPETAPALYADEEQTMGALLYGPEGVGKRPVVMAAANATDRPVVYVDMERMVNYSSYDVRDEIEAAFHLAEDLEPCILYLRDLHVVTEDAMVERAATDELLRQFEVNAPDEDYLVTASTEADYRPGDPLTRQADVEHALLHELLESGRFSQHLYIGMPNGAMRQTAFETALTDMADGETVRLGELSPEDLVEASEQMTTGDIRAVCARARRYARFDLTENGDVSTLDDEQTITIDQENLVDALHEYRRGLPQFDDVEGELIRKYSERTSDDEEEEDDNDKAEEDGENEEEADDNSDEEQEEDANDGDEEDEEEDDGFMWE